MMAKPKEPKGPRSFRAAIDQILEHDRKRRPAPKRQPRQGKLAGFDKITAKRIEKAIAADEASVVDMVVTKEAQAHGKYELVEHRLFETVKADGKIVTSSIRVVRNRGGTTLDRWHAGGRFDQRQWVAILFYQAAYGKYHSLPRVTANLEPIIRGGAGDALEYFTQSQITAKISLDLIDEFVLFPLGLDRQNVFTNVVLHDEPAGVAGGRLGYKNKPAEVAALDTVRLVALMIADLVVDRPRHDFELMLRNLDAPRASRIATISGVIKENGPLTEAEFAELEAFGSIDLNTPLSKRGRNLFERWIVHGALTEKGRKQC